MAAESGSSRLRAALDATRDAVLVTDRDGIVVAANLAMAELNGMEREAAIGRPLLELAAEMGAEGPELAGLRAALDGQHHTYTAQRHNRRGDRVSVVVTARPLPDDEGVVLTAQGLAANREQRARTAYTRVLAQTAETLGSCSDLDDTLSALAEVIVPQWADGMLLALTDRDGLLRVATVRTVEGVTDEAVLDTLPPTLDEVVPDSVLGRAVREGKPMRRSASPSLAWSRSWKRRPLARGGPPARREPLPRCLRPRRAARTAWAAPRPLRGYRRPPAIRRPR